VHKDSFKFETIQAILETHIGNKEKKDDTTIFKILRGGELKGYVIYAQKRYDVTKAYQILEISAEETSTFTDLINHVIEKGIEEDVDFIYLKENEQKYDNMLKEKGFVFFIESAIMVALLNPHEFFRSISQKTEQGKIVQLNIHGSDPIFLRVGRKVLEVVADEEPNIVITLKGKTFLRLLFGRTTFLREYVNGRTSVNSIFNIRLAHGLFDYIRQDRWYIPLGDWL
jgi:hypothetical protein